MTVDAQGEIGAAQAEASNVPRWADMDTLERVAWIIYAFICAVLPLVVVLLRTEMLAWHYYVAGAVFLGGALAICAINLKQ